jgi:hypothetical protein
MNDSDFRPAYDAMSFSKALTALKDFFRVTRDDWKDTYLQMEWPSTKLTLPYIYMRTEQGHFTPWTPSQADLLANDWYIVQSFVPALEAEHEKSEMVI